jgi:hypothetical protein
MHADDFEMFFIRVRLDQLAKVSVHFFGGGGSRQAAHDFCSRPTG